MNIFYLLSLFFSLTAKAQAQEIAPAIIDINLAEICDSKSVVIKDTNFCEVPNPNETLESMAKLSNGLESYDVCRSIEEMKNQNLEKMEIKVDDNLGTPWKIRFHFGYTKTNYRTTDVKLESTLLTDTIKGFEFDERNSSQHYYPKNWSGFSNAFTWIDEPSNTIEISVENKKNAFYITAFHPKTLATYYVENDGGNIKYTKVGPSGYISNDPWLALENLPQGVSVFEIQNTHKLMNYSVGYGRKLKIFETKKAGDLTYTVRVDLGAMVGGARSLYLTKDGQLSENKSKLGIQGFSNSLGHRVEYHRGKLGVFVEQKYTQTKLDHEFLDGKASYDLDYSTISFGVNVDLFTQKKKKIDPTK